jgi:hypothetical protein
MNILQRWCLGPFMLTRVDHSRKRITIALANTGGQTSGRRAAQLFKPT